MNNLNNEDLNDKVRMNLDMKCKSCGSDNVISKDGMRRTGCEFKKGRMVSKGYFYTGYTCECGEYWEIKK